jgi:hypothetical protein
MNFSVFFCCTLFWAKLLIAIFNSSSEDLDLLEDLDLSEEEELSETSISKFKLGGIYTIILYLYILFNKTGH